MNVVLDFTEPAQAGMVGDGYRVDADIVIYTEPKATKVPVGALFRDDKGWAVFVVEAARASRRSIEIGHRNGREATVTSGLAPGERVVLYPPDSVKHGARVRLRGG